VVFAKRPVIVVKGKASSPSTLAGVGESKSKHIDDPRGLECARVLSALVKRFMRL